MKNLKYIFAAVALSCLGTACNESSWLKETPYDFYTPENSYTTTDQFQNALNYLYDQVRGMRWKMGKMMPSWFTYAKVRASFAQVGNDMDAYQLYNYYEIT